MGSAVAALAVALGGVWGCLQWQRPTPVSAQTILRRAAAALPGADDAHLVHERKIVYYGPGQGVGISPHITDTAPLSLTVDQWTQPARDGGIGRQVATARYDSGALDYRILQVGQEVRIYGARQNAIDTQTVRAGEDGVRFDNPLGGADLRQLALDAANGSVAGVALLPNQTIEGTTVDAVEVTGVVYRTRLYIDPTDYTIRGWDQMLTTVPTGERTMGVRVTRREIVPVPEGVAGLFTLGAPATATMYGPPDAYPHPTVAQAVALSGGWAPLLAGDTHGFRLRDIVVSRLPERTVIDYQYEAHPRNLGALDAQAFDVQVWRWPSAAGDHQVAMRGTPRPVALTIAGRTVRGQASSSVNAIASPSSKIYEIQYQEGATTVWIGGFGLSGADEFAPLLGALVGGADSPATVAQLQRELGGGTP